MLSVRSNPTGEMPHGWSPRSITCNTLGLIVLFLSSFAFSADSSPPGDQSLLVSEDFLSKVLIALVTVLSAQAIIPLVKAWIKRRMLRTTYRYYLNAHVNDALESFGGAGSTHFAEQLVKTDAGGWLQYLEDNKLGVPRIFIDIETVKQKALNDEKYIPSVSYYGFADDVLNHTSPIWELAGPESGAAMKYFLTQQQVQNSIEYLYTGWYFDLIKTGTQNERRRWCLGLENVLFDLAQHYKASMDLKYQLERILKS